MAEAKKVKEWLDNKAINQKEYDAFLALKSSLVVDPNVSYELERLWKALIAEWSSIGTSFDNKKVIKQWLVRDFTYDACQLWFNRIGKGVKEADFARWLRDDKKWTAPDELNGWLTDDNITHIIKNKKLTVNSKEISKAIIDHRVAGDFRVRTDVAQVYDTFIIAQKSAIEGVDKEQLDGFIKEYNALDLLSKKRYTIFPIRVSGNHWGVFIIGDDDSGIGKVAWYTSSGGGVDNELATVKPLIERLTDSSIASATKVLTGQKQTDVHNCGVFLIFYIWEILEKQKIELTKNYSDEELTNFRKEWQAKLGKEKWCILDSYWKDLRTEYANYIKTNPWTNPYESAEDKIIDEIIIALDGWMHGVITEKFATTDLNIRDEKDVQIKAIKTANKLLLDDEIIREEQYKGVRGLLEIYLIGSSERNLVENFAKQWAKVLGISEPDWKEKKADFEKDIRARLNKYPAEAEFNKIGKGSFRGKDTWLDYLNTIDKEGAIDDTIESSFYFVKSNLLYPLAKSIVEYLLAKTYPTSEDKLKAIEEYIRNPYYQHPSEKAAYGEYKTQIEALKPSSLWPNEATDKDNAIKRVETLMKDDGSGRYAVSDNQLDVELALP